MHTALTIIKRSSLYITVLLVTAVAPVLSVSGSAFAEEAPEPPCVAPADNTYGSGIHHPTGSDANTFTYRCKGDNAGTWTNSYFVYDPVTSTESPLFNRDYQYNCDNGAWTMTDWNYSPARRIFVEVRVTASPTPTTATNCPVAPAAAANTDKASGGSGNGGSGTVANTGPSSTNSVTNNGTVNSNATNNTTLGVNNGISSQSGTGNTFIIGNTSGGSATSGDAQTLANIANLLQSSSNSFGPNTAIFTANINGDVNGDFMFDPNATLSGTGPGSTNSANNNLNVNTNNTNNTDAQINNDINVGAASGSATVADNTKGGDATSGDAQAIVNLMNLINSTVSSGQSFIGTVNINGNLNGDILLPQNLIDQLLASNTGPGSTNSLNNNYNANTTVTNNVTSAIANNVTSAATTGDATVAGNTSGGTATSGNGTTNVTLLNLTGSNTIGKNNILVFVNVLGSWIGMIMNAPAGATAASLGGGINGTGPDSDNSVNNNVNLNGTLVNNSNFGITNNVNAHATTGDATVAGNTSGGNATSGDASTAVNILNMSGSNINLSDWFGILFINVFGNWQGSFGVNTSAGDPVVATPVATSSGDSHQNAPSPAFASFAPRVATNTSSGSDSGSSSDVPANAVLASILGTHTNKQAAQTVPTPDNKSHADYTLPIIGITIAIVMLAGERIVTIRKSHKV